MSISPLAGKPAPAELLIDPVELERAYHERRPEVDDTEQLVSFGTSGHRGSPLRGTFTETHIQTIAQAICDYRRGKGIDGPLYMGKDTHCLSGTAQRTALEVLAANGVQTIIQRDDGVTPTPVISRTILVHNRAGTNHLADGIVITPSHNPPGDGGIKYNPPNGGPADTDVTKWIEERANEYLLRDNTGVQRIPFEAAIRASTTHQEDFVSGYVNDLRNVIDMEAIRGAQLKLGVDPLGGASVHYWAPINETYGLNIDVVNPTVAPTFSFMTVDHDGQIRMDCSSPYAMARLVDLKDRFRVAFANDPDADRHGIVTPSAGLMNPNHYLAVAIGYLLAHRPGWPARAVVGKTLVSSGMIDRVVTKLARTLCEVPVGFKWFAPGLFDGSCCFGGEESRRGKLLAARRNRVDHGQGRSAARASGSRDHGRHRQRPRRTLPRVGDRVWHPVLHANRCPRDARAEGAAPEPVTRGCERRDPGRRADHGEVDPRSRQQRPHRRPQGCYRMWMVRGPTVRYGGCVQALRGKLQESGAPRCNR